MPFINAIFQNVFHLNSESVQTTSKARDLGVMVTDNLK